MATAELANDLAIALDPVCLAEAVGLHLDRWQRHVVWSPARRQLLNVTRQGGKSTAVAVLACHTALYDPGSLTLILSPGERQSKETFRKVINVYHALDRPIPADAENKLELELNNGSRIVALPGTEGRVRGYSGVRLLIADEASRIPDALMAAVRPMLAVSGGQLIALSTPWGKRGWWYEAWEHGGTVWQRTKITAYECPRITPEFLEEERSQLPPLWFNSEYLCRFEDTVNQVFVTDDIEAAISDEVQPLFVSVPVALEESCEPLFVR